MARSSEQNLMPEAGRMLPDATILCRLKYPEIVRTTSSATLTWSGPVSTIVKKKQPVSHPHEEEWYSWCTRSSTRISPHSEKLGMSLSKVKFITFKLRAKNGKAHPNSSYWKSSMLATGKSCSSWQTWTRTWTSPWLRRCSVTQTTKPWSTSCTSTPWSRSFTLTWTGSAEKKISPKSNSTGPLPPPSASSSTAPTKTEPKTSFRMLRLYTGESSWRKRRSSNTSRAP